MEKVIREKGVFTTESLGDGCGITRASVRKVLYGRETNGHVDCACGTGVNCYVYERRKNGSIIVGCQKFDAAEVRRVKRLVPRRKKSSTK